jgi:hypothetical protein
MTNTSRFDFWPGLLWPVQHLADPFEDKKLIRLTDARCEGRTHSLQICKSIEWAIRLHWLPDPEGCEFMRPSKSIGDLPVH